MELWEGWGQPVGREGEEVTIWRETPGWLSTVTNWREIPGWLSRLKWFVTTSQFSWCWVPAAPQSRSEPLSLLSWLVTSQDEEEEEGWTGRERSHLSLPLHSHQPGQEDDDMAGQLATLRLGHHHHHHGQLCRHGDGRQTVQQWQVHHVHKIGEFPEQQISKFYP